MIPALNGSACKLSGVITAIALLGTGCGAPKNGSKTNDSAEMIHTGQAVSCTDGDTCNIRLDEDDSIMKVRLIGIDAPETSHGDGTPGQPLGQDARAHINEIVKGKSVRVNAINLDRYGRTLGEIYVGKLLVNVDMLKQGLAEAYIWSDDVIDADRYRSAESKAKGDDKGIWSLSDYESPEDYRRRMREEAE